MRAVVLVAAFLLTSGASGRSIQVAAVSDLVIEEAAIDPNPLHDPRAAYEPIVVRVRNQGQRNIVAWAIRATVTDANGATGYAVVGTDHFEYGMPSRRDSVLSPNDTYAFRFRIPREVTTPVAVDASVEYVVFDDNTGAGDERSVEIVFELRARHAAAWQFIERTLTDALNAAQTPDAALFVVSTTLAAAPRAIRVDPAVHEVTRRIHLALRSVADSQALAQALTSEAAVRSKNAADRSNRRDRATAGGLVVEDATIDLGGRDPIVVRVRNEGQRTIVAWGVYARLFDANDVLRETAGGKDGYEWEIRDLPDNPVLQPNDSYTIRLPMRAKFEAISVKALPAYAIFDDNSAVGDERAIELRFRNRAGQAVAWQFIEQAVAAARASAPTADRALQMIAAELDAAPSEIHGSFPRQEVSQRITFALKSPADAQVLLRQLSIEAGSRRKAAAERSVRKK